MAFRGETWFDWAGSSFGGPMSDRQISSRRSVWGGIFLAAFGAILVTIMLVLWFGVSLVWAMPIYMVSGLVLVAGFVAAGAMRRPR
jgi:hypothetical protein